MGEHRGCRGCADRFPAVAAFAGRGSGLRRSGSLRPAQCWPKHWAEARAAHFIRRRAIAACGLADKRLSAAVRDAEAAACDANLALGAYGAAVYGATAPEVVSC